MVRFNGQIITNATPDKVFRLGIGTHLSTDPHLSAADRDGEYACSSPAQ